MNTVLLRTYVTIVQCGNLSKASELLFTSQSTVSYRLKKLEEEVNGALVIREKGTEKIAITPLGDQFYLLAMNYLLLAEEMMHLNHSDGEFYFLIVAGTQSTINVTLKEFITHLISHNKFRLYLYTDHSYQVVDKVTRFVADTGFINYQPRESRLNYRKLFEEELCLLCRQDSPFCDGTNAQALNPRYEIYSLWSAEYENWHRLTFGITYNSMLTVRTGGSLLFDSFFHPEMWYICPYSVAQMIMKTSDRPLVIYSLDEPLPKVPILQVQNTQYQNRPSAMRLFNEQLDAYVEELKRRDPHIS